MPLYSQKTVGKLTTKTTNTRENSGPPLDQAKRVREYLVKRKGYNEPEWLPVSQSSYGALHYEYNQGAKARARFQAMRAGEDHPRLE
ncbi:LOW QUALITY PROTEIN: Hypothetical protein PHPALM_9890 [Phytophthora palmivora]|uniref:Uncharacterized protein n=1 Tax=Phytophthora palmivora TaxID=4796 RepID=A0A2P4Y6G6_9STRA|nr:LOW QUALITY PROTEIN: Hypothetical protein PHPALM_9890 [Phytophthora palmivora]